MWFKNKHITDDDIGKEGSVARRDAEKDLSPNMSTPFSSRRRRYYEYKYISNEYRQDYKFIMEMNKHH